MSSSEEVQIRCELIQKAMKDNDLLKLYKLLEEANEFGQLGEIERIMKNNEKSLYYTNICTASWLSK